MPSRSSVSSFALAGLLGLFAGVAGLGASLAGCGSFGAADSDGGAPAEAATAETGTDATATIDGGPGDANPAPADCMDLTNAAVQSHFTSSMDHGGVASAAPNGLTVTFPDGATDSTVSWRRAIPVGGATGLTLRIEGAVNLASGTGAMSWFGTFAGISHGPANAVDTSSFVHLALSAQNAKQASMDLNLFPSGTANNAVATATSKFGVVPIGGAAVSVVLDVTWSTTSGPNAKATLGGGGGALTNPTLKGGGPVPEWTLYLGGYAQGPPVLSIVYTKVCITLR